MPKFTLNVQPNPQYYTFHSTPNPTTNVKVYFNTQPKSQCQILFSVVKQACISLQQKYKQSHMIIERQMICPPIASWVENSNLYGHEKAFSAWINTLNATAYIECSTQLQMPKFTLNPQTKKLPIFCVNDCTKIF